MEGPRRHYRRGKTAGQCQRQPAKPASCGGFTLRPAPLFFRFALRFGAVLFLFEIDAPSQNGRRQDIVINFVPLRMFEPGHNARLGQLLQQLARMLHGSRGELGQVRGLIWCLRPAGSNQEEEHAGADAAIFNRQFPHHIRDMRPGDLPRAPQPPQRLQTQPAGVPAPLFVPNTSENQLKYGGRNSAGGAVRPGRGAGQRNLPGVRLPQYFPHQFLFDFHRFGWRALPVVSCQRSSYGLLGAVAIQIPDLYHVPQQVRDAEAESFEPREPVLAQRDEYAGIHIVAIDGTSELALEPVGGWRRMKQVILELVEQKQKRSADLFARRDQQIVQRKIGRHIERLAGGRRNRGPATALQARVEIRLTPVRENHHRRVGLGAQPRGHSRPQQRTFTRSTGAVKHCQGRGVEIGGDDFDVAFTAEKQGSVGLLERLQAYVRASAAHAQSACSFSFCTNN